MARRTYTPGSFSLLVKRSPTGLGLFAGTDIPKDSCIIEYTGRILSGEEADTSRSKYLFGVTKKKTIEGKPSQNNKAGYTNHSCRPNAEAIIHKQRVFFFAIKNIKKGDEITFDYGKEYTKEHCTPCKCAKCMPELHEAFATKRKQVV